MEIKKAALEQLINESLGDFKRSPGFFSEDRFAIHCADGCEVQVVITAEESDFIGEVIPDYAKAGDE